MDGFGAGAGQFKAYEYRAGEIMVLQLADNIRSTLQGRNKDGDVKSLRGKLKMSDFGTGITSSSASYQKALKREQKRQAIRHRNQIRREAAARAQIYIPQTPETAQSYEEITAIISDLVGGVPDDILHQTAYELLRLLKTDGITDTQRMQGIDRQLCVKVPPETVSQLFTKAADLTDFTINSTVDLQEADEDGIVAIGNEADAEEFVSSSSSDDEEIDSGTVAPPQVGAGGWDENRLFELLKSEFEEETVNSKLDLIKKLLQSESGAKLETEIARVFKFKHLDVVANIIKNKDYILKDEATTKENDELKKIDLNRLVFEEGSHFLSNNNAKLPIGTETKDTDTYREISVPFQVSDIEGALISINDLPEFAREAFRPLTTLNKVQSKLYKTAMETDKNILVAAPTGSGKTNIALLCVLREFMVRPKSKIVYVAPMKSLVQEMVGSFSYRLKSYNKTVVELTGDSSASKAQLSKADIIVTTPEKWDIVTRKVGSRVLSEMVSLLIIDEIHLLHDERGPVLEALVARMKRTVDTTRQQLRFVGLSATMPNYDDVALFLRVDDGLFVFDERYRPCPLSKIFIGVRNKSGLAAKREMNEICFDRIVQRVEQSQILVFVHSRRETAETARYFIEKANDQGISSLFVSPNTITVDTLITRAEEIHNTELKEVVPYGFAFHNAGLDANDRAIVESLFAHGYIKVLVSTATLAWGVNLPAHTVIIKGTRVYNPEHSQWENLSYLDVLQMFGRAGRPQFDKNGEGIIITELRELQYYVSVLSQQMPIESHFLRDVASHLNAEISLGTITSLNDAAEWIGFTYLFIRMLRNPVLYQIEDFEDRSLRRRRLEIVHSAALMLDEKRLIKYDQKTGDMKPTELGRISADFYISPDTMSKFAQFLRPNMTDSDIFRLFCASSEFKNISVRPEEKSEVSKLINHVPIPIKEPADDPAAKINVLLQCYICRLSLRGFSLMADMIYISQNAERIMRCLYEIALSFGWAKIALNILDYAKMVGARMWYVQSPLRQFRYLSNNIVAQLERKYFNWERYYDLSPKILGEMAKSPKEGDLIAETILKFPRIEISYQMFRLSRNLIKINLDVSIPIYGKDNKRLFIFDPEVHHSTEPFWVFVCDSDLNRILHSELFLLKMNNDRITKSLSFVATLVEPLQPFYFIKVISDRWIPCEKSIEITLFDMTSYDQERISYTSIKDKSDPFGQAVLKAQNSPNESILIAAPTSEERSLCCIRIIQDAVSLGQSIAVIVPIYDKFKQIAKMLSRPEFGFTPLTGDPDGDKKIINPDPDEQQPQKIKRVVGTHAMFATIGYFETVFLYDLNLIGDANFADYESLISIMRFAQCANRYIAITSTIANTKNLFSWLDIKSGNYFVYSLQMRNITFQIQTFNFPTSKSRLMAMARPLFSAIKDAESSIVFVPNQSQMYLTAFELINFANITQKPQTFIPGGVASNSLFSNKTLNDVAEFGVALYHPALSEEDKDTILSNFKEQKYFKCIVAVIDSVWELNETYANVVAMKGTDIYDGTNHEHIEYPIDITMEAMGHTSENNGRFVLFTHTPRKLYYLSFLTEPMCIESSFDSVASNAFNTVPSFGLALSRLKLVQFIKNTFYVQRLISSYRHNSGMVSEIVSELIDREISQLHDFDALEIKVDEEEDEAENQNEDEIEIKPIGAIAANHCLDPKSVVWIAYAMATTHVDLLTIICESFEMKNIPLKSPKIVNQMIQRYTEVAATTGNETTFDNPDDPSTFALVLLRCHMAKIPLPDECKDVFRQVCTIFLRLIGSAIDYLSSDNMEIDFTAFSNMFFPEKISGNDNLILEKKQGWLYPTVSAIRLMQHVVQGHQRNLHDLLVIPFVSQENINALMENGINTFESFISGAGEDGGEEKIKMLLGISSGSTEDESKWKAICDYCNSVPLVSVSAKRVGQTIVVNIARDIEEDEDIPQFVNAPSFPIQKSEFWYAIVCYEDNSSNVLLSMQKISFNRSIELYFEVSEEDFQKPLKVTIFCDSYIGSDCTCGVN